MIRGQVVAQGLVLSVLGCGIGLAGAWGGGRFLESLLFDLAATDPGTLAAAVGILLAVAALASWFPAQRASRVDPIQVLRDEWVTGYSSGLLLLQGHHGSNPAGPDGGH